MYKLGNPPRKYEQIRVVSTSQSTAQVSRMIISQTNRLRLSFVPTLVANPNDRSNCVSGKIVYEKKHEKDDEFPSERLTRGSIHADESMEISLDTSETRSLFEHLSKCYDLYDQLGQIPYGTNTFPIVDRRIKSIIDLLNSDPEISQKLNSGAGKELLSQLFKLVLANESIELTRRALALIEEKGIEHIQNAVSIDRLTRLRELIETNLQNSNEEFWQKVFTNNQWVLSQIFGAPVTLYASKAYLGGKNVFNTGGKICDFLYKNNLTHNVALIEIKTPCTPLLGKQYRDDIHPPSSDLVGSICQVLTYRDVLIKEANNFKGLSIFSPKCVVLVGSILDLTEEKISSLELFRNSINGVTVISFDELLNRITSMIEIITEETNATTDNDFDDIPF